MEAENLYPFTWKGKTYQKKDCDFFFINAYFRKEGMREDGGVYFEGMREDGGVYFDDHVWIYPDGSTKDDDER